MYVLRSFQNQLSSTLFEQVQYFCVDFDLIQLLIGNLSNEDTITNLLFVEPPYNWTKECHWVCDGEDKRICVYHIRNDYNTKGYQVSHCSSCTGKTP